MEEPNRHEGDASEFVGEESPIGAEDLARAPSQMDRRIGRHTFLRRVANFRSDSGEIYRSGLDEAVVTPGDEPGKFNVYLKSHKKTIAMGGAALLLTAASAGIHLQRNRTQRKKMGR